MNTITKRNLLRHSITFQMYTKCNAPPAERNKHPILEALKSFVKVPEDDIPFPSVKILEISSGNGRHITYFAKNMSKKIFWQPSEYERQMFTSICAFMVEEKVENVAPPIYIDIREPFQKWKPVNEIPNISKLKPILKYEENSFDYIYNANMIHISSFDCAEGLFRNCGKLLRKRGFLFIYGPFSQNGVLTPDSNVRFDLMLKASDPSWGIRDIQKDLVPLGEQNGLKLVNTLNLPANNNFTVWVKH